MKHADPDLPAFPASRLRLLGNRPARRRRLRRLLDDRGAADGMELRTGACGRLGGRTQAAAAVVEVLACGGRWDCDRFHHFTLDGMAENARHSRRAALYYPYVESKPGEARKLFWAWPIVRAWSSPTITRLHCRPWNGRSEGENADRSGRRQRLVAVAGCRKGIFDCTCLSPFSPSHVAGAHFRCPATRSA